MKQLTHALLAFLIIGFYAQAQAATITYVDEHRNLESRANDATVGWRNATTLKPLDLDGDNIYGTDGYHMMANGIVDLPTYIDSVTNLASSNNHVVSADIDDPGNSDGNDINAGQWFHAIGTGAPLFSFKIGPNGSKIETLRIAVLYNTGIANTGVQSYNLVQTSGVGTGNSVLVEGLSYSSIQGVHAVLFDLEDVATGDIFTLSAQKTSGGGNAHAGVVAFDAIVIPEPSTFALIGLAGVALIPRRRR